MGFNMGVGIKVKKDRQKRTSIIRPDVGTVKQRQNI
jgi:hypothetical protein